MAERALSEAPALTSFPPGGAALVIGSTGGLGAAFVEALSASGIYRQVIGLSRSSVPPLDLLTEASIEAAAATIGRVGMPLRLVIDATGFLHDERFGPERAWRQLDADHLAKAFAINAIGPALLMKHFLPLLPSEGRSIFATLSAKVGSIGDNRLGGWYSYRASKAALNQLVRTAAIELRRQRPGAICVALHPGTVHSRLSAPFRKAGLEVRAPREAAHLLLAVLDKLTPEQTGDFFDYRGQPLPW